MSVSDLNLPPFQPRPRKTPAAPAAPNLDDWRGFARFLSRKPAEEIVGRSGCSDACPLYAWLIDQGADYASVDTTIYIVRAYGESRWRDLPRWALLFRKEIDRWVTPSGEPVTAERALQALRDVLVAVGEVAA